MRAVSAAQARACLGAMVLCSSTCALLAIYTILPTANRTMVSGVPYMEPLSLEWCLTSMYLTMHAGCVYMLLSGFAIAKQEVRRRRPPLSSAPLLRQRYADRAPSMPTRVAVGCALLFTACVMYLLFFGTVTLSERIEGYVGAPVPPQLEEEGRTTWSDVGGSSAAAARSISHAALAGNGNDNSDGDVQTSSSSSGGSNSIAEQPATCSAGSGDDEYGVGTYSFTDILWTVLESLVDVFAAIVDTGSSVDGDDAWSFYGRSAGQDREVTNPLEHLRRVDVFLLNLAGTIIGVWGIFTFDVSVPEAAVRRRRQQRHPQNATNQKPATVEEEGVSNAELKRRLAEVRGLDQGEGEDPIAQPNPGLTADALSKLGFTVGPPSSRKEREQRAANFLRDQIPQPVKANDGETLTTAVDKKNQ